MAQYLSDIVEEDSIQCSVCEKNFIVKELTLDDWNFAWDGYVQSDCCNDCASNNLCVELLKSYKIIKPALYKQESKYLISAYIFYKWNDADTLDSVLDKCDDGEDTIHTEVSFYNDKVVLRKTDCKIFDAKKHTLEMSYKDFAHMMNKQDWNKSLYDWEVIL